MTKQEEIKRRRTFAIISARTEAFYENRPFNQRDLETVMSRIVPLSDTMEQLHLLHRPAI